MTTTNTIEHRPSNNGAQPHPEDLAPLNRVPSVRTRRRPVILAVAVMLVAVGILVAVSLVNSMSHRQEVLVLAKDVPQGHTLTAADLTDVRINSDAGLNIVLTRDRSEVVGKTVSSGLTAGTLLNPSVLTSGVLPPKDDTLVGITVSPDKLPATALQAGDSVSLVDTPRDQDSSPVQAPVTTHAQVVGVHPLEGSQNGQVTVDVLVPKDEGPWVGARAATHRVAILLETREH